jgi:hypothetical protein
VIVCVSVCVVRGVQFSFRVQDNQDRLGSHRRMHTLDV